MAVPPGVTPRRADRGRVVSGSGARQRRRILGVCLGGLCAVAVLTADRALSAPPHPSEACFPAIPWPNGTVNPWDPLDFNQATTDRELFQLRRDLRALCLSIEGMGQRYGDAVRADLWFLAGSLLGLVGLAALSRATRF